MRCKIRWTMLAAIAGACATSLSAGAALAAPVIQNGDFETGDLTGWTASGVVGADPEGVYAGPSCCGFTTSHPDNEVAVFGGGVGSGDEVLSQDFATELGVTYTINYDFAFIGGGALNFLDVSAGGVTHNFQGAGSTDIDTSYMHDVLSFVGDGNVATVSFEVFDGPADSTDTILDNVRVSVPEPATWALMITGFGLAGVALRRRRGALVRA
jgi:hypothetical protein